jgi:hypothetical protein
MVEINSTNARLFNNELKNAIQNLTGKKINVRIVNSYKFPDCYIQVSLKECSEKFSNEFRSKAFDALGSNRSGLLNPDDIHYGNITSFYITLKANQWQKLFNNVEPNEKV